MACSNTGIVKRFEIDWSHSYTLKNWMTDLDLVCAEPYEIGLLGTISFLSFSLGSMLVTNLADKNGRKATVLYAGLATPLSIVCLLTLPINIRAIYFLIFLVGLTYNARSSVAYLYSSEFLESSNRINIGTYIFSFSGFF
jgi:MFS family permease